MNVATCHVVTEFSQFERFLVRLVCFIRTPGDRNLSQECDHEIYDEPLTRCGGWLIEP